MKKYLGYIIIIAAAVILGLFFLTALQGYSFLSWCLFGLAALAGFFLIMRILEKRFPKGTKILRKIAVYCIIIGLFALTVTVVMIARDGFETDTLGADYCIVLGAKVNGTQPSLSLTARLRAAEKYLGEHPDCVAVLSGGQGSNEGISEAQCMADWLAARGVDSGRLILEDKSSNTKENLAFSRQKILEREPDFAGRVCIVTEVYHVTRAKLYARKAGFEKLTSASDWTGLPVLTGNYYLREAVAIWYYLIFER